MTDQSELAARVEAGECGNRIDVECEIALFKPGSCFTAIRSNAAGTKVIYTDVSGNDVTCWAMDWTVSELQQITAAALRALASQEQSK